MSIYNGCSGLTRFNVEAGSQSYTSIDGVLYDKDVLRLVAFPGGLTSVSIPNSVTTINSYAFRYCNGLTSVDIPNSVINIGESAFYGCAGLESVVFGNSVSFVGDNAFRGCNGLTSIRIPASMTSISNMAFCECDNLKSFDVDIDNPSYASVDGILYNKSVSTLVAFPGGKTSVNIPGSVTIVGPYSFYGNKGLTSVRIPSSVTIIGTYAFCACEALETVSIGNSVATIGDMVFASCDNLTTLYCYPEMPPAVPDEGIDTPFDRVQYENTVLYVPIGSKANYEAVRPWKNFWDIRESDFASVDDIAGRGEIAVYVSGGTIVVDGGDGSETAEVFSASGRLVGSGRSFPGLACGVYIVRVGDKVTKIAL